MSTADAMPSARDLGISARHRRSITREHHYRWTLQHAREADGEAAAFTARTIVDGVIVLEIVGGEGAADDMRAYYRRIADQYRAAAREYLIRRARGERVSDVIMARYNERKNS